MRDLDFAVVLGETQELFLAQIPHLQEGPAPCPSCLHHAPFAQLPSLHLLRSLSQGYTPPSAVTHPHRGPSDMSKHRAEQPPLLFRHPTSEESVGEEAVSRAMGCCGRRGGVTEGAF